MRSRVLFEGQIRPALGIFESDEVKLAPVATPLFGGDFDENLFTERVSTSKIEMICPLDVEKRPQIVCVGRNYAAHAKELGNDVPLVPKLFLKPYTTLCGPEDDILLPGHMSTLVHHEGEIALVIGKKLHGVTSENACDFIAGYTLANDVTARDVQRADGAFSRGKGFATFCPLGPWVQPLPEESSWSSMWLETWVNGERRQRGDLRDMVFPIGELLAFIAQVFPLEPGDVVLTGTPEGVGPILAGDKVEVRAQGTPSLRNRVAHGPSFLPWR
ncbi:MAG: fumarylacetoacetate hydrolase family protein [Deltaproteobacteria bacterium]|nr:fumarylacetoacetate hydrolase family protein [Deltaproteobacteria bacterium]